MSTELDGIFVPLAYNLISEFGKSITLTQTARGAKNDDTGVIAAGVVTAYTIKGVISKYDASQVGSGSSAETAIRFDDQKIMTYAYGLPTDMDKNAKLYTVTIDSVVWNVVTVTKNFSGEDVAYYDLQVRQ